MNLQFTDGVTINTNGPLRKLYLEDRWYIIGGGFCIPVADENEADETIIEMMASGTEHNGKKAEK